MKAILISIKPKYVAKILNGEKTIEIRKTMPKCEFPIDVYIYCTKEEELFYNILAQKWFTTKNRKNVKRLSNGVIKAKFTLNKVEHIESRRYSVYNYPYTETLDDYELIDKSCLSTKEIENYLKDKLGYAWHIDNLVIFDKPKELSEFEQEHHIRDNVRGYYYETTTLTKAPQSWCYIESEELE